MNTDELDEFLKGKERPKGIQPTGGLDDFLKKKELSEEAQPTNELDAFLKLKEKYPVRPEELAVEDVPERMKLKRPEVLEPGVEKLPIEKYIRPAGGKPFPTIRAAKPREREKARREKVVYGAFDWPGRKPFFVKQIEPKEPREYSTVEKIVDVPMQFIINYGNMQLFGIPGMIHKKRFGEDIQKPMSKPGEMSAGLGSLTGMIGPGAAISPFKLSGRAARAIFSGTPKTAAGVFLQGIERSVVTLSLAEGAVEWEGENVKEIALNKLRAMKSAAPAGLVFGVAPWLRMGKKFPALSTIFRVGAGSAAIDLIHGQTPWDGRDWQQKAYDYGLNFYFLRHGHKPGTMKRLADEGKAFNKEAKRDGFEELLPETPEVVAFRASKVRTQEEAILRGRGEAVEAGFKDIEKRVETRPIISSLLKEAYARVAHNAPLLREHKEALKQAGIREKEIEKLRRFPDELPAVEKKEAVEPRTKYPFFPADAPQIWRDVMDMTSGRGVRPFIDKTTGKPVEYEEYKFGIPKELKRKEGFPPDEVAQLLGLEDSKALYKALERGEPMAKISEEDYYESEAERYEESEMDRELRRLEEKYEAKGGREITAPGLTIEFQDWLGRKPLAFEDPAIENRFQKAMGVQREPLRDRLANAVAEFKRGWTRTYKFLPNTAEFIEAKTALITLEGQRGISVDRSLRVINQLTKGLHRVDFDLFRRKVIVDDLTRSAELGLDLPFKFTGDILAKEKIKIDSAIERNPKVKEALADRASLWEKLRTTYIAHAKEAGVEVEDHFRNPNYFHHQVLAFAKARGATGGKMGYPTKRGYLRRRTGSELDINTDYVQAEKEVLGQMFFDIETYKALKRIKDNYDISPKLKVMSRLEGVDWRELLPKEYVLWQPIEGSVFYFTDTIPARLAREIQVSELEGIGVSKDQLRKTLAKGGQREEWAVKREIGETLDAINKAKPQPNFLEHKLRLWKKWVLLNPKRAAKYNIRNLTGDADGVFAGNPASLRKVPQSLREMIEVHIAGKPMSQTFRDWYERGGMKATLQEQEMGELRRLSKDKVWQVPLKPFKAYWKLIRIGTDLREATLRYANYLEYLEQIKRSSTGEANNFGASLPEEIRGLRDPRDKAYRLSKELLGAYDEISVYGSALRKYIYPFWSWQELNFRRYARLFKNATTSEGIATAAGMKIIGKTMAIKAPYYAFRVGLFALRASGLSAACQTWNHVVFPDEEKELPEYVRRRSHIILGRDKDGKVQTFNRLGALIDIFDWFDGDDFIDDIEEYVRGTSSIRDIAEDTLKAPLNKIAGGLSPFFKWPVELSTGLRFYPNVLEPRRVRDRLEGLAKDFSLENEYRVLRKLPRKPYKETWEDLFVYKYDPMRTAYGDILSAKYEFLKKRGIKRPTIFGATPKSNALYHFWSAVRLEDDESARIYFNKYMDYAMKDGEVRGRTSAEIMSGFDRGLKQSVRAKHPMYGLSDAEAEAFFKYVLGRPSLKAKYNNALDYWTIYFKSIIPE